MKIAITGGTGTLGHALVDRLLKIGAERIVIVSRDEVKQAMMALELGFDPRLRFFLGDVRDRSRLVDAFHGCDAVVHAAALKRVDAVAYNPTEVRKTNVEGSANVTAAAVEAGVKKVVMVSSDKACHPTNVYGASKSMMEHEAIAYNAISYPRGTKVSCVRYGNVLGSRGSVVHLWRQAVAEGRPIPLTHQEMTRFWLSQDAAVDTVVGAIWLMNGGEIVVPVMPAMRLEALAEALAPSHPIKVVGLRPGGEKLHETVITEDEAPRTASGPGYYVITPDLHPWTKRYPWIPPEEPVLGAISSDTAIKLTIEDMKKMLEAV